MMMPKGETHLNGAGKKQRPKARRINQPSLQYQ